MLRILKKIYTSLTVRIFIITAVIIAAACFITYAVLAVATPITYNDISMTALSEDVYQFIEELNEADLEDSGEMIDRFSLKNDVDIIIYDEAGNEITIPSSVGTDIAGDEDEHLNTVYDTVHISGDIGQDGLDGSVLDVFFSGANVWAFDIDSNGETYVMNIVSEWKVRNQTTEAMQQVLPSLAVIIVMIAVMVSLFYSRYITRPIVKLSGVSEKMIQLDFNSRCPEKRRDEIGSLGRNLNEMSDKLSQALNELQEANEDLQEDINRERELDRQRAEFFSAASHELKTPITIIKGQLTGMLDEVGVYSDREKYLARSIEVTGRMERLVRELLTISRMENQDSREDFAKISLTGLVSEQCGLLREMAQIKSQAVEISIQPDIEVMGDYSLLQKAVSNLLSNASMHAPEKAEIKVELEGLCLKIENTGSSIPPDELERVFEPFYRVDASRSSSTGGSGMGLYLVKMILDRHDAECIIKNTSDGVQVTIRFDIL